MPKYKVKIFDEYTLTVYANNKDEAKKKTLEKFEGTPFEPRFEWVEEIGKEKEGLSCEQ